MATTTLDAPAGQRIDYASILSGRDKAIIMLGVMLGLFLSALDQTIVSTAMPRIVADLQGIDLLAWVSTAYLLTNTAMVPIYGKLSDIYGRKIILIVGISIFLAASVLCGIASSMIQLVLFRGLCRKRRKQNGGSDKTGEKLRHACKTRFLVFLTRPREVTRAAGPPRRPVRGGLEQSYAVSQRRFLATDAWFLGNIKSLELLDFPALLRRSITAPQQR